MTARTGKMDPWQYSLTMKLLSGACFNKPGMDWIWITVRMIKTSGEGQEVSAMLNLSGISGPEENERLNLLLYQFIDETLGGNWLDDPEVDDVQITLDFHRNGDPPYWPRKWPIKWKAEGSSNMFFVL